MIEIIYIFIMIIQIIKKINIFLINKNTIDVVIKLNKLKKNYINDFFEVIININDLLFLIFVLIFQIF